MYRPSVLSPVIVSLLLVLLTGCGSSRPAGRGWGGRVDNPVTDSVEMDGADLENRPARRAQLLDILSTALNPWMGTPHVWGGTTRSGVDCSGLIQKVYSSTLNLKLPRTTAEMEHSGIAVDRDHLQTGDLVFFKPDGSAGHVGVYMTGNEFIHSSSSRGVIRSSLDERYWDRFYKTARRVLFDTDQLDKAITYAHRMAVISADLQRK